MLVLKLPAPPAAPTDATVGRKHIHYRRAGLNGGEHVGLGDHVSRLVTAPAVALHPDAAAVDEAIVEQAGDARHHAVVRALAGVADAVDHVRVKDHVALAHVVAVVDAAAARHRCAVAVNSLAAPLVVVDEHRVFVAVVEVVGFDEGAVQGTALVVGPVVALGGTPGEVGLLRVGGGYFFAFVSKVIGEPEIGKLPEV